MGNSSYGKLLENPIKYTQAKIIGEDKVGKYLKKLRLQGLEPLETEDGDLPFFEVTQTKKRVDDSFPVHIGNAVLQHSKLHFLRFVYFLHKYLVPGSIRLVYCDTDSIGKLSRLINLNQDISSYTTICQDIPRNNNLYQF